MIRAWAPDDFWRMAQPLIPPQPVRPQDGGKRRADDRAMLAAIVYLVQAGCCWRKLPAQMFGIRRSPRIAGSRSGPRTASGNGYISSSCTGSAWSARSTGPGPWSTRSRSVRRKGGPHGAKPGRPRQTRQQDLCVV
ncbi:transposase [Phytohabitans kaempferiae]|uniref:Transposase n=1 Tax=Phytohabitans kaempferiae TaxID=1620943 RepID=A0ABV6M6Y0_9ACTN